MTTQADLERDVRAPVRTLVVEPASFADEWRGRPSEPVCCGLRRIPADDVENARRQAIETAWQRHPRKEHIAARREAYNDAVMRWCVARGTCDPNDVTAPWDLWQGMPEDLVFVALTVEGVRFVYDALEAFAIETSPVQREALDEELSGVAGRLAGASPAVAARARRLLAFALDLLPAAKEP